MSLTKVAVARNNAAVCADLRRNTKRVSKQEKGKTPMTVSFFGHAAPMHARDERVSRPAVTRTIKVATSAIKEGCKVAFVLASALTVMAALAALDIWIWVPHFRN